MTMMMLITIVVAVDGFVAIMILIRRSTDLIFTNDINNNESKTMTRTYSGNDGEISRLFFPSLAFHAAVPTPLASARQRFSISFDGSMLPFIPARKRNSIFSDDIRPFGKDPSRKERVFLNHIGRTLLFLYLFITSSF